MTGTAGPRNLEPASADRISRAHRAAASMSRPREAADQELTPAPDSERSRRARRLQETNMLTTEQKETILRRAGIAVPDYPAPSSQAQQMMQGVVPARGPIRADAAHEAAATQWARTIDALYVEYAAARAARSLREAEEAQL